MGNLEKPVHYYYGQPRTLCGREGQNLPVTALFEHVTCLNCQHTMIIIARSVYKAIEYGEEYLALMEG